MQALSKTLGKLQFAWRFFTPATMLLVVCACCAVVLYRKVRPEAAKAMAAALLALTIIATAVSIPLSLKFYRENR